MGELTASAPPDPIKWGLLLREGEAYGKGGEGEEREGKAGEGIGREGKGREGRGPQYLSPAFNLTPTPLYRPC